MCIKSRTLKEETSRKEEKRLLTSVFLSLFEFLYMNLYKADKQIILYKRSGKSHMENGIGEVLKRLYKIIKEGKVIEKIINNAI
jgi:hypothetical protein